MKARKLKLPPVPQKMQLPDNDAIRHLAGYVTTGAGRAEAHKLADYYERVIEVNAHNERIAREALRILREVLAEVAA